VYYHIIDMPKGKGKKGKSKADDGSDTEDDVIEEEPTTTKKTAKKAPARKKKVATDGDNDEVDDLSDLDVDEEGPQDTDEVVPGSGGPPPHKEINPRTPIGDLKIEDIFSYLIQKGNDTLNPQLKYGSLNLLQQLTGRRRRNPGPGFGNGNGNGNGNRNGRFQNQHRGGGGRGGGNFQGPPRRGPMNSGPAGYEGPSGYEQEDNSTRKGPRGQRNMGPPDELYPDQ